jgi:hypothetical protein
MTCGYTPTTHSFHDIAKPGDKINWGDGEDYFSSILVVGHDGQLTWDSGTTPEMGLAEYITGSRELLVALYAGDLTVAEYAEARCQHIEYFEEDRLWKWGDAGPALNAYAQDIALGGG